MKELTIERLEGLIGDAETWSFVKLPSRELKELARIATVLLQAQKDAELYGVGFVVCKPNEPPQKADPTKVVLTFTDSGLGYD